MDVSYVAELARLKLSEEEIAQFQKQLGDILGYVQQLQKIDISSVPDNPVDPNLPTNAIRADEVRESLPVDEALKNAPARANDLIIAPKIVE